MFAIIGSWPVDDRLDPDQLAHIAATVSEQAGFVRGFWGQAPDDVTAAHAIIVLDDEKSAHAMARRCSIVDTSRIPSRHQNPGVGNARK